MNARDLFGVYAFAPIFIFLSICFVSLLEQLHETVERSLDEQEGGLREALSPLSTEEKRALDQVVATILEEMFGAEEFAGGGMDAAAAK